VVLSVQLGFAVIPLIHFVSDKTTMGEFHITPLIKSLSWLCAVALVWLNTKLVVEEAAPFMAAPGHLAWKLVIALASLGAIALLGYITLHPWIERNRRRSAIQLHPQPDDLLDWTPPVFRHIAIALDFSEHDEKLLTYAAGQGGKDARYLLIHVVESASARMLGKESDDYETRKDQERLDHYRELLDHQGLRSQTALGFRHRSREIARLAKEHGADMLVIGSHGHTGLKDFIFGETVNAVRHELKIPVLVVNL
jgi:manganese transport protein